MNNNLSSNKDILGRREDGVRTIVDQDCVVFNHTKNEKTPGDKTPRSFSFWTHPDFFIHNTAEELSIYHWIKSRYKNSTIYNFKAYKLAQMIGVAPQTCKKYVNALLESGIAVMHNGNLTMVATRKALQSYKAGWIKLKVERKDTLRDISDLLYFTLIRESKNRQEYVRQTKTEISEMNENLKSFAPKKIKSLKKLEREYNGNVYGQIVFTSRNLASKVKISHSKMAKIILNLKQKGIINRRFLVQRLGKHAGEVYHTLGLGHTYSHNGFLYLHRGMLIDINYDSRFIVGCQ